MWGLWKLCFHLFQAYAVQGQHAIPQPDVSAVDVFTWPPTTTTPIHNYKCPLPKCTTARPPTHTTSLQPITAAGLATNFNLNLLLSDFVTILSTAPLVFHVWYSSTVDSQSVFFKFYFFNWTDICYSCLSRLSTPPWIIICSCCSLFLSSIFVPSCSTCLVH